MLLMLQSANRQTKESLKMFQDRGDVHGFFPPEGDQEAHRVVRKNTPNLDIYDLSYGDLAAWPMICENEFDYCSQKHQMVGIRSSQPSSSYPSLKEDN